MDKEIIIKGCEYWVNNHKDENFLLTYSSVVELLDVLKEQEAQIKNRDESLEKAREEIKWLREMLKEQEAVEPKQVVRKQCKKEHDDGSIDYFAEWYCPHCNMLILRGFDNPSIKFCYKCGKPILWKSR